MFPRHGCLRSRVCSQRIAAAEADPQSTNDQGGPSFGTSLGSTSMAVEFCAHADALIPL